MSGPGPEGPGGSQGRDDILSDPMKKDRWLAAQDKDEQLLSGVRYDYLSQEEKDKAASEKRYSDWRGAVAGRAALGQSGRLVGSPYGGWSRAAGRAPPSDREVQQGYVGSRAGPRPGEQTRRSFPGGFLSTIATIAGMAIGGPVGMGLRVLSGFSTAGRFLSDRAKKASMVNLDLERTATLAGQGLKEARSKAATLKKDFPGYLSAPGGPNEILGGGQNLSRFPRNRKGLNP